MLSKYVQKPIEIQAANPSCGLFDKIIAAIASEKEFKQTSKLLFFFSFLFIISVIAMPFSLSFFASQWRSSGAYYFIITALGNLKISVSLWQDFILSILEALPVLAIVLLAINIALFLFAIRLFLHRQGLLLKYIRHKLV